MDPDDCDVSFILRQIRKAKNAKSNRNAKKTKDVQKTTAVHTKNGVLKTKRSKWSKGVLKTKEMQKTQGVQKAVPKNRIPIGSFCTGYNAAWLAIEKQGLGDLFHDAFARDIDPHVQEVLKYNFKRLTNDTIPPTS